LPVAIFGRKSVRQRLRRANQESLTIPTCGSPVDCTPWVVGGIWPAELSTISAETATLAEYLRADLRRIANSANDELKIISPDGVSDSAQRAQELRVIDDARARAVRRVESTVRHLRTVTGEGPAGSPRRHVAEDFAGTDLDKTQVIAAVTAEGPAVDVPEITKSGPHTVPPVGDDDEPEASAGPHRDPAYD
jgi:hypothetical protein